MDLWLIIGVVVAALLAVGLVFDVLRRHARTDETEIAHGDLRDAQAFDDGSRGVPRADGTLGPGSGSAGSGS
ncbi:hypothetical protein CLV46_0089 [Diaminobutyricimonas aerilata]|uniref:Uncharacterized protein n=1 Tax=Diaminobutyricimonas aerilata TaxID=1162967 RepID=A0A2M9CFB8_9MICO|nr:hypothetical protein [Diaminobutyricimonas aerilata]PJJ70567.1 hypothetical protein CLV46_0089 [Diaminobutyricimonas aerilata]